jgi:hypothetical protein
MDEIWKSTISHKNVEVSNIGRVRYKEGTILVKTRHERHLNRNSYGYLQVNINGSQVRVHKLVAEAFIGPKPCGYVIDHIDNNKANNCPENLRYITNGENVTRNPRTGGQPRFYEGEIYLIRKLLLAKVTAIDIARMFRCNNKTIRNISKREDYPTKPARINYDNSKEALI